MLYHRKDEMQRGKLSKDGKNSKNNAVKKSSRDLKHKGRKS